MTKIVYKCNSCNETTKKWSGKCDSCGSWNSLVEDTGLSIGPKGKTLGIQRGRLIPLNTINSSETPPKRILSKISELDRVLGGGLVQASAILVGGDPGIGKSTLLLQAAAKFSENGLKTIYISGEEAESQIRMRAQRLQLNNNTLKLGTETNLRDILTTLENEKPGLAIIDSIQTLWADNIDSAPGSVSQVRAACHELVLFAKKNNVAIILVGHVTKDGQIAGPRVVEHMVDTVLYFEGDREHQFRIIRSVKNRYGAADEIGVFEMTGSGLSEVLNPSAFFLSERENPVPGSAVFAGIEGTRPLLVEIQALVAPSTLASPRRAVVGLDSNRLSMILAVFEARCNISFSGMDVYLNVAGGIKIKEPAADLAIAAALLSAINDTPINKETVIFGEISLSGALRATSQAEKRLKEAQKLGFNFAIASSLIKTKQGSNIKLLKYNDLNEFVSEQVKSKEL